MQKNTWTFDFLTSNLRDVSYDRREEHRMWLKWWDVQREDLLQTAKDKNITVVEPLSIRKKLGLTEALMEYYVFQYSTAIELRTAKEFSDKTVLSDLERDLSEVYRKIKFHYTKMNEYSLWYKLLANTLDTHSKSLDYDDYVFFFGEPFEYRN